MGSFFGTAVMKGFTAYVAIVTALVAGVLLTGTEFGSPPHDGDPRDQPISYTGSYYGGGSSSSSSGYSGGHHSWSSGGGSSSFGK